MDNIKGYINNFINGRLIIPTSFEECLTYAQQILFLAMHKQNKLVAGDNITIVPNEDGTYTITSTGGASLDIEVQATVDAEVGTPYVTVDTTDLPNGRTRYTFNFHNIKGEQGEQGETGNDGFSPVVNVFDVIGGHEVQIEDSHGVTAFAVMDGAQGPAGADGQNGQNGSDGVSPTISTSPIVGGTRVFITDAQGTSSFDVMNGQNGQNGQNGVNGADGQNGTDGVSPTVNITPITGGNDVSITDANGTHTFSVMNGANGTNGTDGTNGTNGTDGVSPSVSVSPITGGHRVSITDANGTDTFDVMDGQNGTNGIDGTNGTNGTDGTNGVSPVVTVTQVPGGNLVSITDAQGTTTFTVTDGTDGTNGTNGTNGTDGTDGVSPTVSVQSITGGHRVDITDAIGTNSFDVMDGTNGTNGTNGTDGTDGTDGVSPIVTATQITGGQLISIEDAQGTSVFSVMNGTDGNNIFFNTNGPTYRSTDSLLNIDTVYWDHPHTFYGPGTFPEVGDIIIAKGVVSHSPYRENSLYLYVITEYDEDSRRVTANASSGWLLSSVDTDLPVGGTTGQVLAKASDTDYDTEWVTPSSGGGQPMALGTGILIGNPLTGKTITRDTYISETNTDVYGVDSLEASFWEELLSSPNIRMYFSVKVMSNGASDVSLIDITPNRASVVEDNIAALTDMSPLDLLGKVRDHNVNSNTLNIEIPLKGGFILLKELKVKKSEWSNTYNAFDVSYEYYIDSTFYPSDAAFYMEIELVPFI